MANPNQKVTTKTEPAIVENEVDPGSSMIATLDRATIDLQIATAKRYPRSVTTFQRELLALATADETIAKSMFYRLPRDGKTIEGPTVRMAEIAGSSWGNLRYGARIVEENDKFITAQGMCFDLEKNLAIGVEIRRRITDRNGRRYGDDMIQTTGNAAMSIALRNAIFRVVPGALIRPVLEEAKKVSLGKSLTMDQRREKMFAAFGHFGASESEIFYLLQRRGVADITVDDLITLQGFRTAIDDGETTWGEILDNARKAEKAAAGELPPDDLPGGAFARSDVKWPDQSQPQRDPRHETRPTVDGVPANRGSGAVAEPSSTKATDPATHIAAAAFVEAGRKLRMVQDEGQGQPDSGGGVTPAAGGARCLNDAEMADLLARWKQANPGGTSLTFAYTVADLMKKELEHLTVAAIPAVEEALGI